MLLWCFDGIRMSKKIKTKEEAPLKLGYRNVFFFSFTKNVSQSNILKVGLKRNNNWRRSTRPEMDGRH